MLEKLKKVIINLFNVYIVLSFPYHIYWSIHSKGHIRNSEYKLSLFVTLIVGFYYYYKGYMEKNADKNETNIDDIFKI